MTKTKTTPATSKAIERHIAGLQKSIARHAEAQINEEAQQRRAVVGAFERWLDRAPLAERVEFLEVLSRQVTAQRSMARVEAFIDRLREELTEADADEEDGDDVDGKMAASVSDADAAAAVRSRGQGVAAASQTAGAGDDGTVNTTSANA